MFRFDTFIGLASEKIGSVVSPIRSTGSLTVLVFIIFMLASFYFPGASAKDHTESAADAYYTRAMQLKENERQRDHAMPLIDRAIVLNPSCALYYEGKVSILLGLDEAEAALPIVNKAIALNPKSGNAWLLKAQVLLKMRRYPESLASIDRSLALQPKEIFSHRIRAQALVNLQRYDEAAKETKVGLIAYVDQPKELALWHTDAMKIALFAKDWQQVITSTSFVLSRVRNEWDRNALFINRAKAYVGLKQFDRAKADYERAAKSAPSNPLPHYELAKLYKLTGDTKRAELELKKAEDVGNEFAPGRNLGL